MAWKIELSGPAQTNLRAIDHQNAVRILRFLHDRVAALDDPRGIGEAFKGSPLGRFWNTAWATIGSSPASKTPPCGFSW